MKKNDITFFIVLLFLAVFQLTAQDTADVTQADDPKKLLSMIASKQYEALFFYNSDTEYDEVIETKFELRTLYSRYFQTEESLRFDKNTYFGERLSEFVNYIISDDGAVRVVSWYRLNGRIPDADSIVQFRDSSGKLRTASIPKMVEELSEFYPYYNYNSFFNKIYKLKENVYLLEGRILARRYEDIDFLTLELKEDTVIPYFAFKNNNMTISISIYAIEPVSIDFLNNLPEFLNVQIIPQPGSFAIELDMLFPKDHLNMYEWVNDHNVTEEETFKHKEKFVFNGTEFVGNYWVLLKYWSKGERPEDISQFFPKIEFIERAKRQEPDETENTSSGEAEIIVSVSNPSEEAENITPQTDKKKKHFPLFILPLFTAVLICGIYYQKKLMRKLSLRKGNLV